MTARTSAMEQLLDSICDELAKLPRAVATRRILDRRGLQNEAAYRIAHAVWLWDDTLRVGSEFALVYWDNGVRKSGYVDLVVYDATYTTLLLAIELVSDHFMPKDLYKLCASPIIAGGLRLGVQLNPHIEYPIDRRLALDAAISDEQAASIIIIANWQRHYTMLDRREWARGAQTRQEIREIDLRTWAS